jgi:predicted phage terminase large subunit-like protein
MAAVGALARVERVALRTLVKAERLRRDMPAFMRWAWGIDPSKRSKTLIWNWHLDAICDHLAACRTGDIRRLIINVPPRTLKSWTVSVAFPAWTWASDPSVQFLAASADRDIAHRDADAHRNICLSQEYREMFRVGWDFGGDPAVARQAAKGNFRNSAGGHRISKAMGSKGAGQDADIVIFDDPLDPADAFSDKAAIVQHVVNAKQRFMTRQNDPDLSVVILIMQRLHELDLSGVFLADGGWEHVYLPAEYEGRKVYSCLGDYDPRTEEGELLFPKRLHAKFLEEKKTELGSRGYAGQFQQNPAPAAGAMVQKKWLRYWIPSELPAQTYTIGSWDCTFGSKTSDADYVVGQTWGVDGTDYYLLDQIRRKMNLPEMIEAIREQERLWPGLRAVVVERAAAGKDVIDSLSREVYALEPYDPQSKSKEQRLAATLPLWEQGRVFLPHPIHASTPGQDFSWVRDYYVPELLTFPGARHDDQVDATSQALIWITDNGPGEVQIITIGGR